MYVHTNHVQVEYKPCLLEPLSCREQQLLPESKGPSHVNCSNYCTICMYVCTDFEVVQQIVCQRIWCSNYDVVYTLNQDIRSITYSRTYVHIDIHMYVRNSKHSYKTAYLE